MTAYEPHYIFKPIEEATRPQAGRCIVDHWWAYVPGKGLAFYKWYGGVSPQCNADRRVIDGIHDIPDVEAVFLKAVFVGGA